MKDLEKTFGTLPPSLVGTQMGVWQMVWERSPGKSWHYAKPSLSDIKALLGGSYSFRFLADVYRLSPGLVILYTISFALLGINEALKLQFMNRIFEHVSRISQLLTNDC